VWYYPDRSRTDRLSIRIGYIPSCWNYHYPDNISIPHLPWPAVWVCQRSKRPKALDRAPDRALASRRARHPSPSPARPSALAPPRRPNPRPPSYKPAPNTVSVPSRACATRSATRSARIVQTRWFRLPSSWRTWRAPIRAHHVLMCTHRCHRNPQLSQRHGATPGTSG
jgi:hypothetical protein